MANPPKIRDLSSSAKPAAPSIQHPLAGKKMSGAEMIVQVLADEGVTTIFGYSGGAILPTYDAVFCFNEDRKARGEAQMPLIVPANEQGAGSWPPDMRVPAVASVSASSRPDQVPRTP
jgi:hypothetical protein